jgi:xylulokinase
VKAGLLNLATLKLECVSMRGYEDSSEQDPDTLWGKTIEAVKESVDKFHQPAQIKAIGVSGQMHGAVLYDANGDLIPPLINWKDEKWSRKTVLDEIKLIMGDRSYDELGTELSSGYTGEILFGIKEMAPDLFRRIAHFVLPTDFLRGKLLGVNNYATDPTNAFGTGLFNTKLNHWHTELVEALRLPMEIFPEVHATSQIAGGLSRQGADLIGLEPGIPIIFGGGDNQMSMLGSGLSSPASPILINVGTAAQISKVAAKFERYPGMDTRSFFNGVYAIVGASLGGGGSYQWLREQIKQTEGVDLDFSELDKLAEDVTPGADGLFFCTGSTRKIPDPRRGFFGNTHKRNSIAHRARAVMEGVLMDLYASFETLRKDDQRGFLVGAGKGLQKSRVWSQIAADLFGKPMRITGFENAVFGAALMAAYSLGEVKNLEGLTNEIESAAETIPDTGKTKYYQDEFVSNWRTMMRLI